MALITGVVLPMLWLTKLHFIGALNLVSGSFKFREVAERCEQWPTVSRATGFRPFVIYC
jgi:hypothetical protein